MAAKVPAGLAPAAGAVHAALAGWIALVIASNERELKLASLEQGTVTLKPDDLDEQFPKGLNCFDGAVQRHP